MTRLPRSGHLLLLSASCACADFVGLARLDLETSDRCAELSTVALQHPGCDPSPWFPAVILQSDPVSGNATVVYGWTSDTQEAWTRATLVPLVSAAAYDCLQEDWLVEGERGRGYDFRPSCAAASCVTGCTVSVPGACDGRTRLELGEVCTVPCAREGLVNLTCDGLAWPELRGTVCTAETVYCDELNGTAPDTPCEDRGSTTASTTLAQADRRFRGCSELLELSPGVVGMPGNRMTSGAFYLEVGLESESEVAGFVDASWAPGSQSHQWLSTPGTSAAAGRRGLAVRFVGEGLGEVRFAWDGTWGAPRQFQFDQYLIIVVFTSGSSTWRIPRDSWLSLPPTIFYAPLTQRPFPEVCHFPLHFQMMAAPPVCRDGLSMLATPEDCSAAGFYLGLASTQVLSGDFAGWPANCFFCQECDQGDMYFNNASLEETATESIRQAPSAAALCSDLQGQSTTQAPAIISMVVAEFRLGRGRCPPLYAQISDAELCERAATELALVFDGSIEVVSLPRALGSLANYWPEGCFYCALCDTEHVFLNRPDGNLTEAESAASSNGAAAAEASAAVQLLCRALPDALVTSTTSEEPWLWTLPITTTFAAALTQEPVVEEEATTSAEASTTLAVADAGIIYLGDVQCGNPYLVQRELQWWEEPAFLAQAGGAFGGCFFLSVCLWFWGICHKICNCVARCCCCCCKSRQQKAAAKEEEELIFFNPPPGWQPTRVPGLQL